jgi:hypothetical protein
MEHLPKPQHSGHRLTLTLLLTFTACVCAGSVDAAVAATPAPAWAISSASRPTTFSSQHNTTCAELGVCDSFTVLATNAGGAVTDGSAITVADKLPEGVVVKEITGVDWAQNIIGEPLECTTAPLQCTDARVVAPDDRLEVTITVELAGASGALVNEASVTGGGASTVTTSERTAVGAAFPFNLQDFGFGTTALDGSTHAQAGEHPYEQTTSLDLTAVIKPDHIAPYAPTAPVKDIVVNLPLGFLGNPQATPRCPLNRLEQIREDFNPESPTFGLKLTNCPAGSRVGIVSLASGNFGLTGSLKPFTHTTAVFNMVPEGGHPAELGFIYQANIILLYADVVRTAAGYGLRVTVPGIPSLNVLGTTLTLFGQPGPRDGQPTETAAFITNPAHCTSGPLMATIQADSWTEPTRWVSAESIAYPHVEGCELLQFTPELAVRPETAQSDTPSGYEFDIRVPRSSTPWGVLEAPQLKDAEIRLPPGLTVTPAAADGLKGCPATGSNGIDIPHGMPHADEAGEGESLGPSGLSRLTAGNCPDGSRIGEVEVITPLLEKPLTGHIYLAQPKCGDEGRPACTEASATNGELFGLYLEAASQEGEDTGVIIKLEGKVSANPATGQLTAMFDENPQLPFSELKVRLNGGPRAPLANPQTCGQATTTSVLTPWSAPESGPPATPFSSFAVSGCANPQPFGPSFTAGTVTPTAAGFSPFTLTFSRHDGEQDLSGLTVQTPPGLLGVLSQVQLCPEPQASTGTCGSESLIGHTQVAAGAGSHPFWVGGDVYLTGSYKGASFGLSVVVPAIAGPFDLGDVIVRAAVFVDPHDSHLTIISDPLPQIIDGVPLRVQTVNVSIDKPNFMFNPTNCSQQQVAATITATQGATANVASPFAAAGCKNLPFKPGFTVSTQAKTSKANGASLKVKITQKPGEANIHKVDLQLPLALPSRLTTLQKACSEAQFATNPAGCPAGSVIGTATAHTPVLQAPLTGPAYLVSHAAAAFPDVVFLLQGDERGGVIRIDLVGNTAIKKGITYSRFETVPDTPISSFETSLPEGSHSALSAFGNLCTQNLVMPTTLVGQNGAEVTQDTKIAVTGCKAVTITKRKLSGRSVLLSFFLTAKGIVTVTGKGLKRYRKTLPAGTHQIKVTLSNAGLAAGLHHKKTKITVALKSGAKTSSATTTLKL